MRQHRSSCRRSGLVRRFASHRLDARGDPGRRHSASLELCARHRSKPGEAPALRARAVHGRRRLEPHRHAARAACPSATFAHAAGPPCRALRWRAPDASRSCTAASARRAPAHPPRSSATTANPPARMIRSKARTARWIATTPVSGRSSRPRRPTRAARERARPSGRPAHPQHAIEIEAGREPPSRIEAIEGIDQPHDLAARGRRRQRRHEHTRAARSNGGPTISEISPRRHPPAERVIERGHPRRRQRGISEAPSPALASVPSSFRAWSRDSSRAMAADFMPFSLFRSPTAKYRPVTLTGDQVVRRKPDTDRPSVSSNQDCQLSCPRPPPTANRPAEELPPLAAPRRRRAHPSQFPHRLVRRARLDDRHVDAEVRAELARLRSDAIELLSGRRRLPRPAADPALHADRRRHRRSARSPAAADRVAVRAGVFGVRRWRCSSATGHVTVWLHLRAVVHLRLRPGLRRTGLSVDDSVARARAAICRTRSRSTRRSSICRACSVRSRAASCSRRSARRGASR